MQAMIISQSPAASPAISGRLCFGGQTLLIQEHIKVLGVTVDCGLCFDLHVAAVAHQASLRVSALHRMVGSLNSQGIFTLYKAQIRPCMEYSALSWIRYNLVWSTVPCPGCRVLPPTCRDWMPCNGMFCGLWRGTDSSRRSRLELCRWSIGESVNAGGPA
ncbi:hypothetical protein E2C01_048957 [Portunus trituberculatus]|uniref:Uncharacterized protein n=1 Tax=Portunus trituberculatus TaxID=210409 RepID=A0A5B7GBX0_PORTR|nr:hypothetical protein [Portunus trituberculatus]